MSDNIISHMHVAFLTSPKGCCTRIVSNLTFHHYSTDAIDYITIYGYTILLKVKAVAIDIDRRVVIMAINKLYPRPVAGKPQNITIATEIHKSGGVQIGC